MFSTSIRNELSSYKHKEYDEGGSEFSVMKARLEEYVKMETLLPITLKCQ